MKTFKKALAILLCLMMLTAVAPLNAFAETDTLYSVTLKTACFPAVGAEFFTPEILLVNAYEDFAHYVESVDYYWFSSDTYSTDFGDYTLDDGTAFEEGKAYCLFADFIIADGIAVDHNSTSFTLECFLQYMEGVAQEYVHENNFRIAFFFDVVEMQEIYSIQASIKEPVVNDAIADGYMTAISATPGYTSEVLSWREEGTDTVPTVFEEDKVYYAKFKFTLKPGYYFGDDIPVAIDYRHLNADQICYDESGLFITCECSFYIIDPSKSYPINVINGTAYYAYDDTAPITESAPGTYVKLVADEAPEGQMFSHWEINDTRNFSYWNAVYTEYSFEMPSHEVTLTAVYSEPKVAVGTVEMEEGKYLANGSAELQETEPEGGYAYLGTDGILYLDNFEYSGDGYGFAGIYGYSAIYANHDLDMVVKGDNKISLTNPPDFACSLAVKVVGDVNITSEENSSFDVIESDMGIITEDLSVVNGKYTLNVTGCGIEAQNFVAGSAEFDIDATEGFGIYVFYDFEMSDCVADIDSFESCIRTEGTLNISDCVSDFRAYNLAIYNLGNNIEISNSVMNFTCGVGLYCDGDILISDSVMNIDALGYGIVSAGLLSLSDCTIKTDVQYYAINGNDGLEINGGSYILEAEYYAVASEGDITINDCEMLAVSRSVEEDEEYWAIYTPSNLVIDCNYDIVTSENADGSDSINGFMDYADYVKIGDPKFDYSVTVINGTASHDIAAPGETVTLTAGEMPSIYVFDKWVVTGATVEDETSEITTFVMPANDVTAEAIFVERPVDPDLPDPPAEKYSITVISGTASKYEAEAGETITISADAAPAISVFDKWVVTGATVEDETSATTTFVMPANNVTAEATYNDLPVDPDPPVPPAEKYSITVANGSASKIEAEAGETITITANAAPAGKVFDKWLVSGATLADAASATTTFVMPANDVSVTATYKDIVVAPPEEPVENTITVINGQASRYSALPGEVITLSAIRIDGKVFSRWDVQGAVVEDETAMETSFTMDTAPVTAVAVYEDCPCKCHDDGILGFFFRIVVFFQKLFGKNHICAECGARH